MELTDNLSDRYSLATPEEPYLLKTKVGVFGDSANPVDFLYGGSSALPDNSPNPEDFASLPEQLFNDGIVKPGQAFRVVNPETKKTSIVIARHAQVPDSKTGLDLAPHTFLELGGSKDGQYLVDLRPVHDYPVARYDAPQADVGPTPNQVASLTQPGASDAATAPIGPPNDPQEVFNNEAMELGKNIRDKGTEGDLSKLSAQPSGMIEQGNIDVSKQPTVKNPDGSVSTVRSFSANIDGQEVLLPTVSPDGKNMTKEEALQNYRDTGQHLGIFDSPASADAYAQSLHESEAARVDAGAPSAPEGAPNARNIENNAIQPAPAPAKPDKNGMLVNPDNTVTNTRNGVTYNFGDMTYEVPHGNEIYTYSLKSGHKVGERKIDGAGDDYEAIMKKKAAEKGIVPSNYPDKESYNKAMQEHLGTNNAKDIADSVMSGDTPPDLKGLYRDKPAIIAELARRKYNLKEAQADWYGLQRHIASANSTPIYKLRASAETAYHSLDLIDEFAKEWKANAGSPILNKANLAIAINNPLKTAEAERLRSIAIKLEGQITDLQSEIAVVNQGGGVPTIPALENAKKILQAEWDEKVLLTMTNLSRRNLDIRLNSLKTIEPAGQSVNSNNAGGQQSTKPTVTSQEQYDKLKSGDFYLDKNGGNHQKP